MRYRWGRPAALLPIAALTAAITMVGGCASVQGEMTRRVDRALSSAGVTGVTVEVAYRDVVLSGPAALETAAVDAAGTVEDAHSVLYRADDGHELTPGTTEAAP